MQNRNKGYKQRTKGPFVIANDRIRAKEVRVNFPDGESQVLSLKDALDEAKSLYLDLVLIAEKADPPVCKIIDLNKHLYSLKQKEKLAKKQLGRNLKMMCQTKISIHCCMGIYVPMITWLKLS